MALWRSGPYAPVKSGSDVYVGDGIARSGWFWDVPPNYYYARDPVTLTLTYLVACHNFNGAAYDISSVVLKVYTLPFSGIGYGPEKTQDPTLWQTISMPFGTAPVYGTSSHWCEVVGPTITDEFYIVYWVVEASGEPVISTDGILWTGDEYIVIDTPAFLVNPMSVGPAMTAMLSVDFDVHIEDPDSAGVPEPHTESLTNNASMQWWIDWGDGNIQSAVGFGRYGSFGYFSSGGIGFHAYHSPGTYTVRVYCGFYGGRGGGPNTIAGLMVPTLLGTFSFTASMPSIPVFAQPHTMYTMDITDRSFFDPRIADGVYPHNDTFFGDDNMIGCIPFSVLRTSSVPITPKKITPASFTFHKPYVRDENGFRYSSGGAANLVGVDTDLMMSRELGRLSTSSDSLPIPTDPNVPEFTEPTWQNVDFGYYTHGDGPNPSRWRLDTGPAEDLYGYWLYGVYYLNDYHVKTHEGVVSSGYDDYTSGYHQQTLTFYSTTTGAVTRIILGPDLPDSPVHSSPEAYAMYGDDEVMWMSATTSALWRHNHTTGVSHLIGDPFSLIFNDPNNRSIDGTSSPYHLGNYSDGYSARIINVRNDGSVTILVYSRRDDFVPDPTDFYDLSYGGYAWWAFSIDRGGRMIGEPRRIGNLAHRSDEPFSDFGTNFYDYTESDHTIVADPDAPIVYVPAAGRRDDVYNGNVYQAALYAVDLVTGENRRAVWFGHPYVEWNWDAMNWTFLPPETYTYGDLHDTRYLEPGYGFAATNIPPGTWKLRPPPGVPQDLAVGEPVKDVKFY